MTATAARRALHLGVAVAVVSFVTSCQQSPRSLVGPTGASAGSQAQKVSENGWGSSRTHGDKHAASNESDFFCALGPFGAADSSNATMSASGNETVVCTGKTEAAPDKAERLEGFPCLLHFGDGDPGTDDITFDSRAVVTPSGHVTLVCQS